ncbi:MAG: Ig-like domain-containing protein [Thermoproteota archaeon]
MTDDSKIDNIIQIVKNISGLHATNPTKRISISGSVSPADPETADVPVTLQFSSDEVYWFNITNISCVLSNYSYSWTPELPAGDYFIRAVWSGSDTYLGTESTHQSLIISKTQTTLTCRFDKEMIEVDKDVGVSGSISPAINDVIVTLMFTPPDGNSFIETVKTSSDGSFHFEIKTSQEGTWKVKAYWPGNENCFGSESTDSEMRVANPPSYLIVVLLVTIVGVTIISGISMFFVLRGREKKGGLPSTPTTYTPPSPPPPPESPKEEPPPRPSEKKPRYFEKDNMGIRQDSLSSANAYWIARISSPKVPFVVYTFDAEKDARDALLELDCIHVAEDTGKLICTKVLIYGYYLTEEGKYEVIVCGDELTHELWEKAKESFAKHGGKWKNDQEPEVRVVPVTEIKEPEIDKIVFVREDRRLTYGQTMIYRIYRGPDAATAKAFLQQNPVTRQYYYIVVETPEGNYARDIYGIYKE